MSAIGWILAVYIGLMFGVLIDIEASTSACLPEHRAPRAELPEAKVVRR